MILAQLRPQARAIYVGVLGSALACAVAVALLAPWAVDWDVELASASVAFLGLCIVFQVFSFSVVWRGQRIALHPDEAVLLLGVVILDPGLVVALALVASVLGQLLVRKPAVKLFFNVGAQLLGTAAGAAAFALLRDVGAGVILAAISVPAVVSAVNQSIVAVFLTSLGERPLREAWTGSLFATVSVASLTGILVGMIVVALFALHPLAVYLAAPAWMLLNRTMGHAVHVENELATRRALNELSSKLLDADREEEIAAAALAALDEAFAPAACGLELQGRAYPCSPSAPVVEGTIIDAPLAGCAPGDRLWISMPARRGEERERLASLLGLVANQVALALARAASVREAALHREAVRRAERLSALGTLVAGIAHEVNNPLMYMGGSLDLLEMDVEDMERTLVSAEDRAQVDVEGARERVKRVRAGVARIQKITRALAVVARLDRPIPKEVVQVRRLFADTEALVRAMAPPGSCLSFRVEGEPAIACVASELRHAVLALAQNAFEALPGEHGHVEVSAQRVGDEVVIRVRDDGDGMDAEARSRAFTPFFTTKPDGIGLGLAGVLSIVTSHGGVVRVESEPHGGTLVEMRLPAPHDLPLVR